MKTADNITEFLMRDTAEETSLLFFLMIMMLLLLHCHHCVIYRVLQERNVIQRHKVTTASIYQGVKDEMSVSCV